MNGIILIIICVVIVGLFFREILSILVAALCLLVFGPVVGLGIGIILFILLHTYKPVKRKKKKSLIDKLDEFLDEGPK